jgi:hypothetical protein
MWGWDVATAGTNKVSVQYLARGASFAGYVAAGQDIGYIASSFLDGTYSAPTTGYLYAGDGNALQVNNSSGDTGILVSSGSIELGLQNTSGSPLLDFHSSGNNIDYDSRILGIAGGSTSGSGSLQITAATLFTGVVQPSADNTYALGGSANRWTQLYAATGTINTSDPALKEFVDDVDEMAALKRVGTRLLGCARAFKWHDAITVKGADNARTHLGFNAAEVADAFKAEGLDPARYALWCEDDEMEQVEVVEYVEVPDQEEVEQQVIRHEMVDGRLIVRCETRKVLQPKTVTAPVFREDGTPVLVDKAAVGPDGNPVYVGTGSSRRMKMEKVQATATVPVMRKKEVRRMENCPTGRKRLGLRYDQVMVLLEMERA